MGGFTLQVSRLTACPNVAARGSSSSNGNIHAIAAANLFGGDAEKSPAFERSRVAAQIVAVANTFLSRTNANRSR